MTYSLPDDYQKNFFNIFNFIIITLEFDKTVKSIP